MKPSPSAPPTPEDEDIWCFVALGRPWVSNFVLEDCSAQQDRRDAELMFYAQQFKLADTLRISEGDAGVIVRHYVSVCHNADPPESLG
jgi:hypothetical protein